MKDTKEKIKEIALQIVELEKKCQSEKNNRKNYMTQIQQLIENLSLEELLEIDEYIVNHDLLKI